MPPINLLVKPASDMCNLQCKYCFYSDVSKKREIQCYGLMSNETLENMMRKALDYADNFCGITYQGGEPTLAGLEYFKNSIELQKKYNKKGVMIHNSIQTNGYGIDKEWAKFFAENDFLVGISLDGIKSTNDEFRVNGKGQGTFYDILKTIELFKKYNVQFNILTVVNKATVSKAKEIYNFYKRSNLKYLQFIACLDPLGEKGGQMSYSLLGEEYGIFLCELFDLWYEDLIKGKQPYIRQFENYISILMGYEPESCEQRGVCGFNHVLESNGQVYPCDFYVLDKYNLGNINEINFYEIQNKRKESNFVKESLNHTKKCKSCTYFSVCRGGCRRHRIIESEEEKYENYFCQGYKIFFKHSLTRMKAIANELRRINNINNLNK